VSPLPPGPSGQARFCYVGIDTTEMRQSEAALRESEERLRRVVNGAPVPMLVRSGDGETLYVNAAWTQVTGYTAEDIPTLEHWMQLAYREDAERIAAEVLAELGAGREIHGTEYSIWTKGGERRTLQFYSGLVGQVSSGQHIRTIAAIDVTEHKRAEAERERLLAQEQSLRAEAEESNRLKDEFLATLSHELRTPMTAVIGWMSLLTRGVLDEADQTQAFDAIQRNLKLQMQLIEDLLDVSNIIAGKLRLELQPLQLEAVITRALESMHPEVAAKSIRIDSDYAGDVGKIMGNSDRLQQVVTNLLSNAIKFIPEGGQIHVHLQRSEGYAELSVRDNGAGISPDFLPHIFDRFRQADGSNTRRAGGLGLGLAIVRHLVELHGGQITAYSPGQGQGATFTVRLPVVDAPLVDSSDSPELLTEQT
jgi:PAS domain S-box-containing protein